jgi:FAD/FMN-containing dehydrogenase
MMLMSSWGRLSNEPHSVVSVSDPTRIGRNLKQELKGIAYGNGRSYGDICLNPGGILWHSAALNKMISFDQTTGILVCEAGVLLKDVQTLFAPKGWTLAVTPGTQFASVGGAIANDIHGKNHYSKGTFGDHVKRLTLVRTDGNIIECSTELNQDWFSATIGGMGLTGFVSQAELQLNRVPSTWLDVETIPFERVGDFFTLADQSDVGWEHTVSWIDCSSKNGRGLFMRANWASENKPLKAKAKPISFPFVPPISLVNNLSLRPFNTVYFHAGKWRAGNSRQHYQSFFYPLDNILKWNRMYGTQGFFQHQCVISRDVGNEAIQEMLGEIRQSSEGSFLAVLKTFGDRPPKGMMSFVQPGVTLALDFPNRGESTLRLLARLDGIVKNAKGRVYMAKDSSMSKTLFEDGYPNLQNFLRFRDPGISSQMSRRLIGN